MLGNIKKNRYNLYYKKDVVGFKLPMYTRYQGYPNFYSKTRLKSEWKVTLTEEQEMNPHGFAQGKNGYYPLWNIYKLNVTDQCLHLDLDKWFDEDSGDYTITCNDCGKVSYHQDYINMVMERD